MKDVTAEEVKAAALATGLQRFTLRNCSLCQSAIFYLLDGEALHFDPSCDCSDWLPEPRSWQSVADTINRQPGEWKAKIAARFGVSVE